MFCPKCGEKLEESSKFCPVCGSPVNQDKDNSYNKNERNSRRPKEMYEATINTVYDPQSAPVGQVIRNYNPNLDYNPIGMWGYFFYTILLSIPILGWILVILFSLGATKKINLRNFARSWFCIYIIGIVLFLIVFGPYLELIL